MVAKARASGRIINQLEDTRHIVGSTTTLCCTESAGYSSVDEILRLLPTIWMGYLPTGQTPPVFSQSVLAEIRARNKLAIYASLLRSTGFMQQVRF
ncbi:hypothetical protein J6590_057352 [Homalodisca vitripennis]|nr:hypothetical protein J6590_057352 [Homalodisca vitripennis]